MQGVVVVGLVVKREIKMGQVKVLGIGNKDGKIKRE